MTDEPMDMFKQIQKMQSDMQAAQDALANSIIEATAGGGVVKARVTGEGELRGITIDPGVVDPGDVETLEDLRGRRRVGGNASWRRSCKRRNLGAAHRRLDLDSMLGGLGGLLGS